MGGSPLQKRDSQPPPPRRGERNEGVEVDQPAAPFAPHPTAPEPEAVLQTGLKSSRHRQEDRGWKRPIRRPNRLKSPEEESRNGLLHYTRPAEGGESAEALPESPTR